MNREPRVWIRKRKLASGKASYHLRWICPHARAWKSRKVGTDKKRAEREAAKLEAELHDGTYAPIRRTSWAAFVEEHVDTLAGKSNRWEAEHTLNEFGKLMGEPELRSITYGTIETFAKRLAAGDDERKGNALGTVNKKLRYLRGAINAAVKRGYLARSPMAGYRFAREDEPKPRIVDEAEETAILKAAKALYGKRWRALVFVTLRTGGRRGELLSLSWDNVDLDERRLVFTATKGKRDRVVPFNPDVAGELLAIRAATIQEGGPFCGMADNVHRQWKRIRKHAKLPDVTIHDLRRTYVTRLIRAGVPLPTVQKLAGHTNIETTLRFYTWTADEDLRAGVAKLNPDSVASPATKSATKRRGKSAAG